MIFTELDETTREWMLRRFEAEESGGNPYRSRVLSQLGLAHWPDVMCQAITDPDGSKITLAATLNRPDYWRAADARGGRVNPGHASERLAITEFNTLRSRTWTSGSPEAPPPAGPCATSSSGPIAAVWPAI